MSVTELHVRADWSFIRFAYLPLIVAGLTATRLLPIGAAISFRVAPCGMCSLLRRWGNHIEEAVRRKPILKLVDGGISYEDGDEAILYALNEIAGVTMHRRNDIPPWRTNGSLEIAPPFWLSITVRDDDFVPVDNRSARLRNSYAERSRRTAEDDAADKIGYRTIVIWPRQIIGGLFAMMRFAHELQRRLILAAEAGEIPLLLPEASTEAA